MNNEVWVDVVGFEGQYQVSTLGRVKSLKRIINHKRYGTWLLKERILKNRHDSFGYCGVALAKNGATQYCKVHRLVASAFLQNVDNKRTVNHKNGIKHDNRVDNIEWATYSENHHLAFNVLNRTRAFKKILCVNTGDVFPGLITAANVLGIRRDSISANLRGKQKTAGGLSFQYVKTA